MHCIHKAFSKAASLILLGLMTLTANIAYADCTPHSDKTGAKELGIIDGKMLYYQHLSTGSTYMDRHLFIIRTSAEPLGNFEYCYSENTPPLSSSVLQVLHGVDPGEPIYDKKNPKKLKFKYQAICRSGCDENGYTKETWVWKQGKFKRIYKKKFSPYRASEQKMYAYLKQGRLDSAKKVFDTIGPLFGRDTYMTYEFFGAFFQAIHKEASKQYKQGEVKKAAKLIDDFFYRPFLLGPHSGDAKSKDFKICENRSNFCATRDSNLLEKNSKTAAKLNDAAFFLLEGGFLNESIALLEQVNEYAPNRTVTYLNLADAYWQEQSNALAVKNYTIYHERMVENKLESKIPKRVFERMAQF